MKKTRLFMLVGLTLVMLMAAMPAFADPDPGEGNTDVIVTNTNQNTGAAAAQVTAMYYNTSGMAEYNRNQNLSSRASYNFKASDATGLGDNWSGSMVIQSDNELAAVGEIHWTGGSFADGKEADAYTGYPVGATTMYLPYVAYANNQFTTVSVQNTESTPVTILMTYINRSGNADFTNVSINLPALGSANFPMNTPGQNNVPNLTQTTFYQQNGAWIGGIKIETQGGKKIVAVANNHRNQWSMAYNGFAQASQTSYVPSAERRVQAGDVWSGFSIISAQCVSNTACDVRFQFTDQGNVALTLTKNGVAPGASVAANTRAGGDFDPNLYSSLGVNGQWAGSVIVSSTNGQTLAVVSESIRPNINVSGATSSATVAEGGRESFLPAVYQKNSANQSCPPNSSQWQVYSLLRVQNPNNSNASGVTISYFNLDGSLKYQETGVSIPAGQPVFRNTRNNCSSIPLGGNWTGSIYVQSPSQPLVTVLENLWGSAEMAAYNGYSVNR
ncbi:MAG: hypothetical protein KDI03_01450 [Anaerolineae bacterium]|nr:hypothetical protein [Anaerolineae bacterium]MCB0198711.1 hypothetical protein [Anaerolineae bacterium]MCB0203460.1 hypothetical protein [Anaerolineae bacterium]